MYVNIQIYGNMRDSVCALSLYRLQSEYSQISGGARI